MRKPDQALIDRRFENLEASVMSSNLEAKRISEERDLLEVECENLRARNLAYVKRYGHLTDKQQDEIEKEELSLERLHKLEARGRELESSLLESNKRKEEMRIILNEVMDATMKLYKEFDELHIIRQKAKGFR